MSLFQSTILPVLKEKTDETEVRKMGLDLLKKINQLSDSTDSSLSGITSIVDDFRITTGTVARTETVRSLEIDQIALVSWACGVTGGVARAITFALPDVAGVADTYQVSISTSEQTTNSLTLTVTTANLSSAGSVAGGTSITPSATASGSSRVYYGFVKRLT